MIVDVELPAFSDSLTPTGSTYRRIMRDGSSVPGDTPSSAICAGPGVAHQNASAACVIEPLDDVRSLSALLASSLVNRTHTTLAEPSTAGPVGPGAYGRLLGGSRRRSLQDLGSSVSKPLPGGGDREVKVALNAQDFISAKRELELCDPTVLQCSSDRDSTVHDVRDDASASGIVRYCRNETSCTESGTSCSTIPDLGRCGGWRPSPPQELCQDGLKCTEPNSEVCNPHEVCTLCSARTTCTTYSIPPAVFRYYEANITGVQPVRTSNRIRMRRGSVPMAGRMLYR